MVYTGQFSGIQWLTSVNRYKIQETFSIYAGHAIPHYEWGTYSGVAHMFPMIFPMIFPVTLP